MSIPVPIIDSHIHLFPSSELTTLAWNDPTNPLWKQHSLTEYRRAISSSHDLVSGFIFLETDRKTTPENGSAAANPEAAPEDGGYSWKYPLQEVSFLSRIASGRPRDATEGHEPKDRDLCLGIVPWAPLPAGPEVLARYIEAVRETTLRDGNDSVWSKIKGFRYLVQDKPDGTMLKPLFIEGLKLLGRKGLVFDVGVDQHRRGRKQLEEAVEMVERAHEGVKDEEKVTFILSEFPTHTYHNLSTYLPQVFRVSKKCSLTIKQTISVNQTLPSSTPPTPPSSPGAPPSTPSPKQTTST